MLSDAAAHVASAVSAAAAVGAAPQSLVNFTDEGGAFVFDSNNSAWLLENATTTMMVVEQKAVELLPLDTMIHTMLFGLAALFMVIGGAIPYVFQYAEIHKRKNALGFSLLVCLALCVANILRILFWFGKRFETVLLVQSVVMTTCMILMLEISVRMNKKHVPKGQRKSIWKGDVFSAFWKWNDLSSFIVALGAFTLLASIITVIFTRFPIYVEGLGLVALLTEACLGLPQLIRNFQRKATTGMSVKMVTLWLVGDLGKTTYFIVRGNPAQFWVCGFLQITIDILILFQVWFYGRRSRSSRMPQYAAPATAEKL